jgi:hypothetical protein
MRRNLSAFLALAAVIGIPAVVSAAPESSHFKPDNRQPNLWNVKSAIDGDLETAWQLPGDSPNSGEWVKIDVPAGTVDKIGIYPGWGQSEETFADHARVKKIDVEIFCCTGDEKMASLYTGSFDVADKAEMQLIDIPDTKLGNEMGFGGKVKLTVKEFYEGRDYPNLAVSELLVVMGEYDAAAEISEITGEADGHPRIDMQDDNPGTFWAGPAESSITFEASGFGVSSVGIQPGPATHARPKRVKVTANDRSLETDLQNSGDLQFAQIPSIMGYTGSAWGDITVEILEVYPGSSSPEVAIAELKPKATNYDGF